MINADADGAALLHAAVREGIAIADAMGCGVNRDPEHYLAPVRGLDHKPGMLQDLEAGRPMEIDAILTQPLALAREWGVATPVLPGLAALVRLQARAAGLYRPPG